MNPITKVNGELPFKEPKLIVLTLEEAKLVNKALAIASCPNFAHSDTYFAFFETMKKRIEEAEMSKQSLQIRWTTRSPDDWNASRKR